MTSASAPPPRIRGRRPPQGDPVVDRALSLLSAFDAGHGSLSLGELSRRSGIPASSALRLAKRMVAWGALERGEDGRFTIGLRLWEVASLAPRGQGLRQVAMPFMGDLAQVTRQHVLLAVRDGYEALLIERLSSHQAMPVLYRVGGRLPLHSTGVGLVLLAFAEPEVQEEVLSRPMVREPEKEIVSPSTCDAPSPGSGWRDWRTSTGRTPRARSCRWRRRSSEPTTGSPRRCRSSSHRKTPTLGCSDRPSARSPAPSHEGSAPGAPSARSGTLRPAADSSRQRRRTGREVYRPAQPYDERPPTAAAVPSERSSLPLNGNGMGAAEARRGCWWRASSVRRAG